MHLRRLSPALALLVLLTPGVARAKDYAGVARNIVPSGQPGSVPVPAGAATQSQMYDALTPLFDQVSDADVTADFKPAGLGATDCPCRPEATPRRGVKIVRDRFDVPHITGLTRDDVTWATGWVTEEDRGLLLAQGRYAARFAALDAPNINAFGLVQKLQKVTVTKQADAIIDREQTAALKGAGADGRAVLRDTDLYVQGINARLKQEKSAQPPWTRVDVYSINALAGQIFGQGGGDEARRSMLLSTLDKQLGSVKGRQVFDDLSEHEDADAPVTVTRSFPYEQVPAGAGAGNAILDAGSLDTSSAMPRAHASNFLMVAGKRSTTGHPIFVAGPQIGYYYPGLTLEVDLKGPGFQARGAAIPGGTGNVLIGRGEDDAWSLTSAGSDTNDQVVETLCGGSATRYRYKGRCRAMGRVVAGTIDGRRVAYSTTVHGPVQGYATVNGTKVAVSFQRSSHGRDILWEVMFRRLTTEKVKDLTTFRAAAATSPFTFNVAYADDRHIATYSAGRLPIRDPRVDPRLPRKGTGQYEWRGFLSAKAHPYAADPPSGVLVNWNNRPATDFGAADDEWSYGSVQRVQLLMANLAAHQVHSPATVVGAMNKAATQDLPDTGTTLKAIEAVLATGPAPSARDQRMAALLQAWHDTAGSSRLDRDLDGKMDAGSAPAIMDALYPRLADAVLGGVLGPDAMTQLTAIAGATNNTSSGFTGGRIAYVDKDLRTLLGEKLRAPYATRFCGAGNLDACRTALWGAVDAAGNEIAAAQGTDDPDAWTADAAAERISFAPAALIPGIRYTNRPSGIQQVMSFTGHR